MSMLKIQDLTFRYRAGQTPVFEDFSLQLQEGNIIGLLGKNGTGKSTLLYLIAGLLRPQFGSVLVSGKPSQDRSPETLQEVFIVPEEFDLPDMSLKTYVSLNRDFYPNFSEEVLYQCLEDFELPLDLHLGRLSMGQKKKAFMSFAIATRTRLLLMDEPTNGLDIPSKAQFRRVLAQQMGDERTIIVSTHQVHDVETLIDRIIMLEGQQLLVNESTARLGELLSFSYRTPGSDVSDALYAEPTIAGTAVITRGSGEQDTPLNLELLFNALASHPTLLQEVQSKA